MPKGNVRKVRYGSPSIEQLHRHGLLEPGTPHQVGGVRRYRQGMHGERAQDRGKSIYATHTGSPRATILHISLLESSLHILHRIVVGTEHDLKHTMPSCCMAFPRKTSLALTRSRQKKNKQGHLQVFSCVTGRHSNYLAVGLEVVHSACARATIQSTLHQKLSISALISDMENNSL